MELLMAHELVHTFHLDTGGTMASAVRTVLGRVPMVWPLYPAIGSPTWNVEGLATHYESLLTGSGRIPGSFHDMIVRTAALEDGIPELDRVSAPHPAWPGGQRSYTYGSRLMRHIAERYGDDAHRRIVEATTRSLRPTFLAFDHVAERALGRPFDAIYDEWRDGAAAEARALATRLRADGLTETEPVAGIGPFALAPRVSPDGATLSYGAHDFRSDPATRLVDLATGEARTLSRRNQGGVLLGPADWLPDGSGVVLAQLELDGPHRAWSDLWRVDLQGGERRLTRGARLAQPDVGPDGRIAAIGSRDGALSLVVYDPASDSIRTLLEADIGDAYDAPRWSPDGHRIAAGRYRDGRVDVVVVDTRTGGVRAITADDALDLAPAWSPDGRWLLWWSDRSGVPNILAADLTAAGVPTPRRVTNVLTGAFDPEVSPDGRTLYLSVYHQHGWRIEAMPFDPASWPSAPPTELRYRDGLLPEPEPATAVEVGSAPSSYSPWATVRPRFWLPYYEGLDHGGGSLNFVGATSWGEDLVGRYLWEVSAGVDPATLRLEGYGVWTWRGLGNPVVTGRLRRDWEHIASFHFVDGEAESFYRRTDEARLDAFLYRPRWRSTGWLRLGVEAEARETEAYDMEPGELAEREIRIGELPTLVGVSAGPGWSNARRHPFSISAQDGVSASVGVGRWWNTTDGVVAYDELVGRFAGYLGLPLWGFADHVFATRLAGVIRSGDGALGRSIGGVPGSIDPLGIARGGAFLPVRGFDSGDRWGTRAWTASAEWRFPIHMTAAPGSHGTGAPGVAAASAGVLGLSLTAISGSLFVDAGDAFCSEVEREDRFRGCAGSSAQPLLSTGAELTIDFGAFHNARILVRAGIAQPVQGPGDLQPSAYLGFGPAF
jgi:hypothetical protein